MIILKKDLFTEIISNKSRKFIRNINNNHLQNVNKSKEDQKTIHQMMVQRTQILQKIESKMQGTLNMKWAKS